MQTEEAIRHPQPLSGLGVLATDDQTTAEDDLKSKTCYFWNPFSDINLVGPDGLVIRLGRDRNYYGQGIPGSGPHALGYSIDTGQAHPVSDKTKHGETLIEFLERKGHMLRRCWMYPFYNITYMDTIANTGDFQPQENATQNPDPRQGNKRMRTVERRQYAGVCGADMISRYGESHGARLFTPLLGMEEVEANEIFSLVQPYAYKLDSPYADDTETLLYHLTYVSKLDIAGAALPPALALKAEQTRVIMLSGVQQAIKTAREGLQSLDSSMADAALARPGKSLPTPQDDDICDLLGEPKRSAAARSPRPDASGDNEKLTSAVSLLSEIALRQQSGAGVAVDTEETRRLIAEMAEMREALQRERELLAQERETRELAASGAKQPPTGAKKK